MPATRTLGVDVALTRYVGTASAVRVDVGDSWGGFDLALGASTRPRRGRAGDDDLQLVAERANLGQALILRLLTPRGGLARLGHASYGSRLVELVGRPNDETTRALARLHTIEAVAAEPRAELHDLVVDVPPGRPETVRVSFSVVPVGQTEALPVTVEVQL